MRRSGLVVGVTVVAVVVAVVAVRGETAADETDLAVGLAQPSPEPSPSGTTDRADEPLVVSANGVPGLRLGARPPDAQAAVDETPAGCTLVWGAPTASGSGYDSPAWDTYAWVVDDEVVSVVINSWSQASEASDDLRTWLGPTLGSPVQAVQELPGARTVVERPLGGAGPAVSVVTVALPGAEVVYSDLPVGPGGPQDEAGGTDAPGRVTSIEVRSPGGRVCAAADLMQWTRTGSEAMQVDVDGVGVLRLGARADDLAAADGVVADDSSSALADGTSCVGFVTDGPQGWVRALALDGVVTEVQVSGGGFSTSFGLPADADADDVRARFPEQAQRSDSSLAYGTATVEVDGVSVELQLQPELVWLPDLERPFEGGTPRLGGVVLRTPGAPSYPC